MKSIFRSILYTLGALLSPFLVGCLAAAVAGGAAAGIMIYSYMHGELERTYPADFPETWQATMQTIEKLGFEKDSWANDAISGEIKARRAIGTPIRINLELIAPNVTSVRIRVGTEGDKSLSEIIHHKIEENLRVSLPRRY